jgi:hypothetical protein
VLGTFCGPCVVVGPARCLAVYEGRRDPQSVRRGSLRRGKLPTTGAVAVSCPAVPEPTGAVYRPHRETHSVQSLRCPSYPLDERSIPHRPWVPAAKLRPPPRLPCGADGYFLRCVIIGRFPRGAWYFFSPIDDTIVPAIAGQRPAVIRWPPSLP